MNGRDGGPAFPGTFTNTGDGNTFAPDGIVVAPGQTWHCSGMTLRDWFAGQALQGRIASTDADMVALADAAYMQADCMINRRLKP